MGDTLMRTMYSQSAEKKGKKKKHNISKHQKKREMTKDSRGFTDMNTTDKPRKRKKSKAYTGKEFGEA
jgi:hypothetical protein